MGRVTTAFLCSFILIAMVASLGWKPAPGGKISAYSAREIARGRYLASLGGCGDCHSPKIMTPEGPVPDTTRLFSGSPAVGMIPAVPEGVLSPSGWGALTTNDMTAWAGPWGVSFARNLTPDVSTGLGSWTEEMFIKAIRTGKDMGEGRDILPPMPWQGMRTMTDEDLRAIYAYLRSIPAVQNAVPDPVPPAGKK